MAPASPNTFGSRLNMHSLKMRQVSVEGMSFIWGNIFAEGRVAPSDGPSVPSLCGFQPTCGSCSLLAPPSLLVWGTKTENSPCKDL